MKIVNPENSIAAKISQPESIGAKLVQLNADVFNPSNSIAAKTTGL